MDILLGVSTVWLLYSVHIVHANIQPYAYCNSQNNNQAVGLCHTAGVEYFINCGAGHTVQLLDVMYGRRPEEANQNRCDYQNYDCNQLTTEFFKSACESKSNCSINIGNKWTFQSAGICYRKESQYICIRYRCLPVEIPSTQPVTVTDISTSDNQGDTSSVSTSQGYTGMTSTDNGIQSTHSNQGDTSSVSTSQGYTSMTSISHGIQSTDFQPPLTFSTSEPGDNTVEQSTEIASTQPVSYTVTDISTSDNQGDTSSVSTSQGYMGMTSTNHGIQSTNSQLPLTFPTTEPGVNNASTQSTDQHNKGNMTDQPGDQTAIIAGSVSAGIVLLVIIVLVIILVLRRRQTKSNGSNRTITTNSNMSTNPAYNSDYEGANMYASLSNDNIRALQNSTASDTYETLRKVY